MDELKAKVFRYKLAMSLAKRLYREGYLTPEEYAQIDTMMLGKYGLSLDSIFREKAPEILDNTLLQS